MLDKYGKKANENISPKLTTTEEKEEISRILDNDKLKEESVKRIVNLIADIAKKTQNMKTTEREKLIENYIEDFLEIVNKGIIPDALEEIFEKAVQQINKNEIARSIGVEVAYKLIEKLGEEYSLPIFNGIIKWKLVSNPGEIITLALKQTPEISSVSVAIQKANEIGEFLGFYARRRYRLLKDGAENQNISEILEKFKEAFEYLAPKKYAFVLLQIYDVLYNPEKMFYDWFVSHRNEEQEKWIQKEFIKFFLNEHIEMFIDVYKDTRDKNPWMLDVYLPILIKYLPEASPGPKYFVGLYLILIDTLRIAKKTSDEFLQKRLLGLVYTAFVRYNLELWIFKWILDENDIDSIKERISSNKKPYKPFEDYYNKVLENFRQALERGNFDSEQALFLLLSKYIYEKDTDLVEQIKKKINFDLLYQWIKVLNPSEMRGITKKDITRIEQNIEQNIKLL